MTRETIPPLSREARVFLDRAREDEALPAAVRERAMARARAAVIAAGPLKTASQMRAPSAPVSRIRWAIAVAFTCAAGAAVGASAYHWRGQGRDAPHVAPAPGRTTEAPGASAPVSGAPPAADAPAASKPVSAVDEPNRATFPGGRAGSAKDARSGVSPDELRVLRGARAAVAREDFAAALLPIAEHSRRFPDGRLVEEREALRVKALAGLGRTEEARRGADAFARRFPHSVLLPAVSRLPAGD